MPKEGFGGLLTPKTSMQFAILIVLEARLYLHSLIARSLPIIIHTAKTWLT